jgi:PAS domain S-box-containing protein
MPNASEISLNSTIELKDTSEPKYNFGFWIVVLFSVGMAVFIMAQIFGQVEKDESTLIGNSLKTVIGIVGIIMSYSVTKKLEGNLKYTWKILTIAYFFNTWGDTVWYYYASILGEKPFPSFADVGFLIHYPVMLWALLSYPTKLKSLDKKKFLADISIVMLSGSTLVWYFIIHPTIAGITEEDLLSPVLNLSYTVGDMVLLLGIVVVFFRGVEDNLKRALQLIVGGVICMLVADLGFAYLTLQGTYFGGHWIENFFIFNSLSHIYAAYYQYRKSSRETETAEAEKVVSDSSAFNWFPYIAVLFGIGLLAYETKPYWEEPLGIVVFSSIGLTFLVVIRQIIALKENVRLIAESEAYKSERRFRTLVENSSDMMTIRDEKGKVVFRSPSIKNILGYELDEVEGKNAHELIHPEDVEKLESTYLKLNTTDLETFKIEYRSKHKDGSWRVLEGIAKKFNDEANNIKGILINSRDITQRKLDEEKLRIYTAKLEQSNRELQDFAYVASHDLQEPLRKVQAFGDRLHRKFNETLGVEGGDYLERMRNASARMQTLIQDLLTFSRITTKAQPFSSVNLSKIAGEVVSDLEVRIEQSNALVEIGELPQIEADPLQIRQLFQNLIGNALKFKQTDIAPKIRIYAETID